MTAGAAEVRTARTKCWMAKPPERVLFIDDRPENAAGAVAAGMQAIRFEGATALRPQLVSLGVL